MFVRQCTAHVCSSVVTSSGACRSGEARGSVCGVCSKVWCGGGVRARKRTTTHPHKRQLFYFPGLALRSVPESKRFTFCSLLEHACQYMLYHSPRRSTQRRQRCSAPLHAARLCASPRRRNLFRGALLYSAVGADVASQKWTGSSRAES